MRRVLFFVVLLACGSPRETQHVEIAQPLPTFSATAQPAPSATVRVAEHDSIDDVRDLRRRTQRSPALLQSETRTLEQLLSATQPSSPDRPALVRRLAENYVEMRKAGDAGATAHAIGYYTELASMVPTYAQVDEVYYYMALEHEVAGDLNSARRTYYELIKRVPGSKLVPYAYFAFGEIFLHEAKADPSKWQLAEQAYVEVMKFASAPVIMSEAACRLGQVFDAQGDAQRAANMRAKAGHPCG
jgi:TolA-binding protein